MNKIEVVCRVICECQGIDPNQRSVGLGNQMEAGREYFLWEYWESTANEILDEICLNN